LFFGPVCLLYLTSIGFIRVRVQTGADTTLRTPKERIPSGRSGVPKEEFSLRIFEKNLPWGTVLKFSQYRRLLAEVRRGGPPTYCPLSGAPEFPDHSLELTSRAPCLVDSSGEITHGTNG